MKCQSKMTTISRSISRFTHQTNGQYIHQPFLNLICYTFQKQIETPGKITPATFRLQLISETACQAYQLFLSFCNRCFMDAVNKCFGFSCCLLLSDIAGNCPICQQHKFFYQFIRLFRFIHVNPQRFSFAVHFKLDSSTIKTKSSGPETFFT